jgi:hypothetical protein
MPFDHRGRIIGNPDTGHGGFLPMPMVSKEFGEMARGRQRAAGMGGKLVAGDPDNFNLGDNQSPIYALPNADREFGDGVTTKLRKYSPTIHNPDTGEYLMGRTATFTRMGANRQAARAAEKYIKEGY